MKLTRRSFLKILSAGAITITVPSLAIAGAPAVSIIVQRATPSPYDPLAQMATVAWKAKGIDGKQYGDYLELSDDVFNDSDVIKAISSQIADTVTWSMDRSPQVSHLKRPTSKYIEEQLLRY